MLVDLGMKVIGQMISAAATVIKNAVDTLVNALNAFVSWAINFIQAILHAFVDPITQAINNLWASYWGGVAAALGAEKAEIAAKGTVTSQTIMAISRALEGDLYFVILGIVIIFSIILAAITPVTSVFGFLLGIAMSALSYIIMQQAFGASGFSSNSIVNPSSYKDYTRITASIMRNVVNSTEQQHPPAGSKAEKDRDIAFAGISMAIGVFGAHVGIAALPSFALKVGFAAGVIGVISALICAALALPAASTSNDILGWASLFFGLISIGAGAVSAFAGYSTFEKGAGWAAVIIGGISLVIGLGQVWYHG